MYGKSKKPSRAKRGEGPPGRETPPELADTIASRAKRAELREAFRQLARGNTKVPWEAWAGGSCSIFAITASQLVGRSSIPAFVVVPSTWGAQMTSTRIVELLEELKVEATSTGSGIQANNEQLYIYSVGSSDTLQHLAWGNPLQVPVVDLRPDIAASDTEQKEEQ